MKREDDTVQGKKERQQRSKVSRRVVFLLVLKDNLTLSSYDITFYNSLKRSVNGETCLIMTTFPSIMSSQNTALCLVL